MKNYIILHTHKHGVDTYAFQSARLDVPTGWHGSETDLEDDEVLVSLCDCVGVDFEPDRDEYLDINEAPDTSPVWGDTDAPEGDAA